MGHYILFKTDDYFGARDGTPSLSYIVDQDNPDIVHTPFMNPEQQIAVLTDWRERIEGAGWNSRFDPDKQHWLETSVFHIQNEFHRLQFQLEFCG